MAAADDKDLDQTRQALAPTLNAAASVLPLLARAAMPRFSPGLNKRWQEACKALAGAWTDRHGDGAGDVRPAIFALFNLALESGDPDCLRLAEALASVCDKLEQENVPTRTIAALTACIECLAEPGGLEHEAFGERARHFARRLEDCAAPAQKMPERSFVLDKLFVEEALERIERMHEALDVLPPDAYALKEESSELWQQAAQLELWGIYHMAREIEAIATVNADLEQKNLIDRLVTLLHDVEQSLDALDV